MLYPVVGGINTDLCEQHERKVGGCGLTLHEAGMKLSFL